MFLKAGCYHESAQRQVPRLRAVLPAMATPKGGDHWRQSVAESVHTRHDYGRWQYAEAIFLVGSMLSLLLYAHESKHSALVTFLALGDEQMGRTARWVL